MHIGVLVYGRLNKCIEHYNNIIESIGKDHVIDFFLSSDNSSESLLSDFIKLYKPKLYTNQPIHYDHDLSKNYDLSKYPIIPIGAVNIHNVRCHFININRVFSLIEEYMYTYSINYDIIISLRIDCVFQNNFNFNNVSDNTIYIPSKYDYLGGINDQLAYGKVDVMKKYSSINPDYLLEKKLSIPHPESLNSANIELYKLNIERVDINYYLDR
jgi:hypothetical protein